jgi:hypothetical protein
MDAARAVTADPLPVVAATTLVDRSDYRHVIWSLVRKHGAFAAYRYREDYHEARFHILTGLPAGC